jgi:hypothetical protein
MICPITKRIKLFFIPLLFTMMLASCYYDSEEYLYADTGECDTTNVTYAGFVAPLLESNCNSCHNPASPSGNVITSDYSNLIIAINNGSFKGAINHDPGFSPMPKGGNKLPDCDLSKINAWLNAGFPEN